MSYPIRELWPQLEAKVAAFVKDRRLPGASAGIVVGDRLEWSFGYGFADIATGRAPDASTLYPIASITKTFTGAAILQLRDARRLTLDDPITMHVPELAAASNPFGRIEDVTIRRLLSHESGLQGDPPGVELAEGRYEGRADRTLERAAEIAVKVAPHTQFKYSNLGYQLLGEVVARLSGTPYSDYVVANILKPLGMSSTFFEPIPLALRSRLATGYAARWLSEDLALDRERPSVWAEGGLVSCVEDLAKWVGLQLWTDDSDEAKVLAPTTLREMQRPRYLADAEWTEASGISWMSVRRGETIWTHHSGGTYGFSSCACFRCDDGVGAIVLVNGRGDAETLAIDLGELVLPAARDIVRPVGRPGRMPHEYDEYLGFYESANLGLLIQVVWQDGALTAVGVIDDWRRWRLSRTGHPDAFKVDYGVRESGEEAIFLRRADGRVSGLKLGPVTLSRLDRVER